VEYLSFYELTNTEEGIHPCDSFAERMISIVGWDVWEKFLTFTSFSDFSSDTNHLSNCGVVCRSRCASVCRVRL